MVVVGIPYMFCPSNYKSSTKKKGNKMGGVFLKTVLMADVLLSSTVKSFIPRGSDLERGGKRRSGSKSKMREFPSK